MTYQAYIVRDPAVCGGVPVVRGTRVPVRTILSSLEAVDSFEVIMRGLACERSWLAQRLEEMGFRKIEFRTFQVRSNHSWHDFVLAEKVTA